MTPGNKNLPITYREYKFAEEFPILLMEGKSTSPQIDFIHFHNCIEIAFCRKGTMTWNLENRIFSLTPGNICFLPPFFTHGSFFPVLPEAAPKETVPKEATPKEVAPKKAALKVTVSEANILPGRIRGKMPRIRMYPVSICFLTRNSCWRPSIQTAFPGSSPGTSIRIFLKYCLLHFFPNR